MTKISEGIINKVSNNDNYSNKVTSDNNDIKNGDVIENMVSESDTLNNDSGDESLVGVEISDEVVVVNESEREREERLGEYGGQRANFPCSISGVKTPHVFYEDKGSSRGYVGDMVSPKGPLSCCSDVSGKARKYFNDFMLPFAWNEIVQGGCEKYCERERIIELFTLRSSYNELKERLGGKGQILSLIHI